MNMCNLKTFLRRCQWLERGAHVRPCVYGEVVEIDLDAFPRDVLVLADQGVGATAGDASYGWN